DNGVAVALMLSVLDSDIPHPALECLFTTDEENGLTGMRAFDASGVKSRLMINLDSAGEGIATVSCAGGVRCHIDFPAGDRLPVPADYKVLSFEVSGLFGGHSGEDIHLGRIGAIATAARILHAAQKVSDVRICSIEGGSRDNAIPRECFVTAAVSDADAFTASVRETEAKIRGELVADDAGMKITVADAYAETSVSTEKTAALVSLLRVLPHGVHGMSRSVPDLVETSSNLAVIRPSESGWEIVVTPRSSVESRLDDMQERLEAAGALVGAKVWHVNRYPGWDYTVGSPLQQLYLDCYKELFGSDAKVCGIHAGLECGLLKGKLPDMDMISIGPDIKNLHSPDETMSVSSYVRLWELLCLMLKKA
ncbi:MAG: M20/M25/M40 family metallo-hydrolase, partial [Clostridia bacterium]|nr:M20/M25/M40 family metallo-hydrolase [Clostridia bacterium]